MPAGDAAQLLEEALDREAEAHRRLVAGDLEGARGPLREAAERYRGSWEAAGERSFGRLIGLLKTAILAERPPGSGGGGEPASGDRALAAAVHDPGVADPEVGGGGEPLAGAAVEAARYTRGALSDEADSPASAYALALAALVAGDDALAVRAAAAMPAGGPAFARTGAAITALAGRDGPAFAEAQHAIVEDFAARADHLTGVAIADTALVLETLAGARGMRSGVRSPLLPL